jgi:hypothetical protein
MLLIAFAAFALMIVACLIAPNGEISVTPAPEPVKPSLKTSELPA